MPEERRKAAVLAKDGNLITSRNPDDLPAFMRELLRALKVQRTKSD